MYCLHQVPNIFAGLSVTAPRWAPFMWV